jgi:hypothetical protein
MAIKKIRLMKILKFKESLESNKITQTKGIVLKSSVPVTNNSEILQYIIDIQMDSYRNDKKCLSTNLLEELNRDFGKPNKRMRLEFLNSVWSLNFKGIDYNVFSAKGKGTGIEICGFSYDDIRNGVHKKEIKEFLDELYKTINK